MALSLVQLESGYYPFTDKGQPIADGSLYVGVEGSDPEVAGNQIAVQAVQQDGTTVDIAQPIALSPGGVPSLNGSNVVLVADGDYAIKVLSKCGGQVYYHPRRALGAPLGVTDTELVFDTVSIAKAQTYTLGQLVQTKGFNSSGDGGGASYRVDVLNSPDGLRDHATTSGNFQLTLNPTAYLESTGQVGVGGDYAIFSAPVVVGRMPLSGSGLRDKFTASFDIQGATDSHAFADKNQMSAVTDAGTYGAFDATTKLSGSHTHAHMHSYQDRQDYEGTGTLVDQVGFYSKPVISGAGTVTNRYGVDVRDVSITGGGELTANIGVYIRDQAAAATNVGLNIAQTSGIGIFAPGGANSYHKGEFAFGAINSTLNKAVSFSGEGGTDKQAYIDTTSGYVEFGTDSDTTIYFSIGGAARMQINTSASGYTFRPVADNISPLGDLTHRWTAVYAVNGTIQTSDEREKQAIRGIDDAAINAWSNVDLIQYEWKGDPDKTNIGVIAQRIVEAFTDEGLDALEYGLVHYDEDTYSINAVQCLFLEAECNRRKLDNIEARLAAEGI